ncbi:MAG TPA: hypothetical protein EYP02_06940, partial [Sulfurovum sp.]|nr:hypothetical protein [Sulfurovum sp.]
MFNGKKILSGIAAVIIYFLLIYIVLLNYNRHEEKAKNYVEENSNRVTVTLVNSNETIINKSATKSNTNKPMPKANLTPMVIPPIIPLKTPVKIKTPIKAKEPIKRVTVPKKVIKKDIKLRDRSKEKAIKERAKQAQIKQAQIKKDKIAKERAKQAWIKKERA